ncbi:MAG: helix-turn-helix domain-containing protein [Thermovirgaceae bacterium]|nr:helix-turn-helix domain-containing protein [Thermovirgaceae bacterium]
MCNDTNMISASNAIKSRQENENAHISNQRFKILSFLQDGQTITSLDALDRFGCMRLASRISELRRKGIPIRSRFIKTENGKQVKEYWLECA